MARQVRAISSIAYDNERFPVVTHSAPTSIPEAGTIEAMEQLASAWLTSLPRWPRSLSLEIEGRWFGVRRGEDQQCVRVRRAPLSEGDLRPAWFACDDCNRPRADVRDRLLDAVFDALGKESVRELVALRSGAPDATPDDLRNILNASHVTHEARVEDLLSKLREGTLLETVPFPECPAVLEDTDDSADAPPCAAELALPPDSTGGLMKLIRSERFWEERKEAYLWRGGDGTATPKPGKRDLYLLWATCSLMALDLVPTRRGVVAANRDDPCAVALPTLEPDVATKQEVERAWVNSHIVFGCGDPGARSRAKRYLRENMPTFREHRVV